MNSDNKLKMLICEDDRAVAELHHTHLSRLLKSSVIEIVVDGNQAKSNMLFNRYNLILSDLNMPGLNGLELFRFTRLAGLYVPFILCTSMSVDSISQNNAKNFYFLPKPYTLNELKHALAYLLPQYTF